MKRVYFTKQSHQKVIFIIQVFELVKKTSKERITLMFCCNYLGNKLTPLVVAKHEKPRDFKKINYKHDLLQVDYY